jgi:flagellar protein FlgJ
MAIDRIGASGAVTRDTPSTGLDALAKRDARESGQASARPRNEKVDQVSKMYEKQFLGEMYKAMRGTISPTEKPSMAEGIYREQLDSEYVDTWGEQGGIGLSDLIYNQVMDRYFNSSQGREFKKQGPIAITDRDISRVARVRTQDAAAADQIPLRIEVKPAPQKGPTQVQAPWDATIVSKSKVDGKTALTLEHGPGLRSTVIFDGVPAAQSEPGAVVKRGESIGTLGPETHSFLWNMKHGRVAESPERAPAEVAPSGRDEKRLADPTL